MENNLKKYSILKNTSDTGPLNKTLFVFYTHPTKKWKYKKVPSCYTSPIGSEKVEKYTNEEQFSGPPEKEKDMIKFLEDKFEKLKEKNAIGSFIIKITYMY